MGIPSINDTTLQHQIISIINHCYTEACITNKYTIWWDKMKYRISVLVCTYEDAKVTRLKRNVKIDETIVHPNSGHSREEVLKAKKRIKDRNTDKRQTEYLINKSLDQIEGAKMTRFQFRINSVTTYLSS